MWYTKNLQTDNISKKFKEKDFPEIAKRIMRFQIVNHCATQKIKYAEKSKIQSKLGIPRNKLSMQKK